MMQGKVAVIFGGSGAIGSAVARVLAREGAWVWLGAGNVSKLDCVAGEIRNNGGKVDTFLVDVLDETSTN